ncbi:MAG TPA: CaiB/BaiF CoA-transferase family protein [Rhodospirillales bacterium]|nr:CaiB/BaiF CoA-transferase family protein [Rhodospirillales bacterium]
MSTASLPLAGVRVLDAASFVAAPYCATILSEFGAEVIKVEEPGNGDPFRRFGTASGRPDSTLAWLSEARNKKSITLNLRSGEGARLFRRLTGHADVVCENFRPGTLERWGLGWDALSRINPKLILLRVTGYGQTGPYRDRPGFARIAHAVGGLAALAGMPDGPPVTPGSTSLGDYLAGLYGAVGVLIALLHVRAGGPGQVVDIGLYEAVFRVLDELAPAYAHAGIVRGREGFGTRNACPHGHFPTRDDKWVAIACTTDKMFARLAQAMGRPDLATGEAFGIQERRLAARDIVDRLVAAWTGRLTQADVMACCLASDVPAGPVNSIAEIFDDPQFAARENLITLDVPGVGPVVVPNVLPKLTQTPGRIISPGPSLGESNGAVYGGLLGLDAAAIDRLRATGVI